MVLPVSDTPFAKLDRGYHAIEKALNYVAAAFLFSLMLLGCAEVLMRKLFNSPIHGQADLVEIMIPTMGFFGLAYCQRLAGHVRMELLIHRLKGRALWIFEFCGNFATLAIVAVMIFGTWRELPKRLAARRQQHGCRNPCVAAKADHRAWLLPAVYPLHSSPSLAISA